MTAMSSPAKVLIIEDNASDAMLIRMAMEEVGFSFTAEVLMDGEVALNRLCPEGSHHELGHPDLIILDLNLPKRDGTEVLQAICGRNCLAHAPVVVLSSSPDYVIERKVNAAKVKADCYLTKPPSLDEFLGLGQAIRNCFESRRKAFQASS